MRIIKITKKRKPTSLLLYTQQPKKRAAIYIALLVWYTQTPPMPPTASNNDLYQKNLMCQYWVIYQKIYFSAKNDQKWPKFAKSEFSLKKGLGSTYTPYWSLTSCKISKKSNMPILSNIPESLFFSQKWPKWPKFAKREFFLKNGLGSTYTP